MLIYPQPADTVPFTLSTAIIDSIAAHAPIPEPGYEAGLQPSAPGIAAGNLLLSIVIVAVLLIAALNAGNLRRAFAAYSHDLWSIRRRPNVFNDDHGVLLRAQLISGLITVFFGGIALYNLAGPAATASMPGLWAAIGLFGAYSIALYCAYAVVAYAFGQDGNGPRWLAGFMATQAYAGILMVLPCILLVLQPQWRNQLLIISVSIYLLGRALFVARGVRIFFTDFLSLLYFILYLCTLEIIPLLAVYNLSVELRAYTA